MIHVSLYAPSNRPGLWGWFYNNIVTDLSFEVIFVGDEVPAFSLPPNVKFIYSTVKISQCAQIAAMNCVGDTMIQICDDLEIFPHVLDKLYDVYVKAKDYKLMVWPRYGTGPNDDQTERTMGPYPCDIGSMMSRQLFNEIGGFDRRYYCNTYDVDLQFRAQSKQFGARYVWVNDAYTFERKEVSPGGLYEGSWYKYDALHTDVAFLQFQWYGDNRLKDESTTAMEPYENNDSLLTVSQGVANDWDENKRRAGK